MFLVDLDPFRHNIDSLMLKDEHLTPEGHFYFREGWMKLWHILQDSHYVPKIETNADLVDYQHRTFTGNKRFMPPIKGRIKDTEYIRHFFDKSPDYEQVKNVSIGKEYEIFEVVGFGDVADAFVIGNDGQVAEVMLDWFEPVK